MVGEDSTATARKLQFGPELVFSHRLSTAFPDHEIRLVKNSAGGTSLALGWLPEKKKMHARFIANYQNALSGKAECDLESVKICTLAPFWRENHIMPIARIVMNIRRASP